MAGHAAIAKDGAKHKTLESFSSKNRDVKRLQHDQLIMQSRFGPVLSSGPTDRYLYYFEAFVQRNVFVPNMSSYNIDIQTLFGTTSGQFLRQAVVSLGALQASRLMHGETGDGWLMHMVHGTANALQAAGPQACKSGLGRSFFLQARIFEASRALLLGENTFLSDPGWEGLTETDQAADGSSNRSCLDIMLSIIVQCSRLRAQAFQLLQRIGVPQASPQMPPNAPDIAKEGFRLRQVLEIWRIENLFPLPRASHHPYSSPGLDVSPEVLLSNVFFAAISIYLSGIFDYEIVHWQRWRIPVPTITEPEIQEHLGDILYLTNVGLHGTSLSPLLFLFPLRIAGARCSVTAQMDCVQLLLALISRDFAVAGVFFIGVG
ncbi:hypothetical protein PG987_006884 [Apiospora arundinis]